MSAAYNQTVQQQRTLSQSIQESLNAIVIALESKLTLAEQQKQLQSEIGVQYPDLSPADVRRKIHDEIMRFLENRDRTRLRDWTTRLATSGGNLEE